MAFKRNVYQDFGQNCTNTWIAGHDVFFVQWAAQNQYRVGFNKSKTAAVRTESVSSWKEFFWQRIRWASKTTSYSNYRMILLMAIIYLFSIAIIVLGIGGLWRIEYGLMGILLFTAKAYGDFVVVKSVKQEPAFNFSWRELPLHSLMHVFYIALIGIIGLFRPRYYWKGRTIR